MSASVQPRSRVKRAVVSIVTLAAIAGMTGVAGAAETSPKPAKSTGELAASAGQPVVVPDRFLRRWDPVTIFFFAETGPAGGGPEDRAERWVTMSPAHPGAFTWLDAKTLQFRPAEPWPPLARFVWSVRGRTFRLATLMAPPVSSVPAAGAQGLTPVEELALTFPEPVSEGDLAKAVTIEVRSLPGLSDAASRTLSRDDFEVKALERAKPADPATYVLRFRRPIPLGERVFVRFRLSLDDAVESAARTFSEISFATAEPFRPTRFGCHAAQLPVVAGGARYSPEQALACESGEAAIVVDFSSPPKALEAIAGRNLVRVTPAVANLEYVLSGKRLEVRGDFAREVAYRVTLAPTPIADERGRELALDRDNELTLSFARPESYLKPGAASGLVERFGPQMIPLVGRGDERLDLRIQRIDPLDRSFWPFPDQPIAIDESQRPPGPGERPEAWTRADANPNPARIADAIRSLGSPAVSTLVDLPLRRDGGSASFGLDLARHLTRFGANAPGTYLVGLRRLDSTEARLWIRVQVTDLALATIEEPRRVVFTVSSLASAKPVAGARVLVEGAQSRGSAAAEWIELYSGTTDAAGRTTWNAPGLPENGFRTVRRVVVESGDDRLVIDPEHAPDVFADNHWRAGRGAWLAWTEQAHESRIAQPERVAHLFSERPVYRPEDPVHLKGYLRSRFQGGLTPVAEKALLIVEGPGDLVWRYPIAPAANGSFYFKFEEKDLPTGTYKAHVEAPEDHQVFRGTASFRKEAYRLPRFEVRLASPDRVPLDREFRVDLVATYYAGGRVAARPIAWRVTQFPYEGSPKSRPGFFFSSDARFSKERRFESTPTLEKSDTTDEDGGAKLVLDPAIEPTSQPRTYVVEATVVGVDDQTVSSSRQIVALPPLLLGLSVPRYVERATSLRPEILVVGPDDQPVAGQTVTVRLLHRQWHSYLRASDFTDGVARYVTEVVDEKVLEKQVVSGSDAIPVDLALPESGVFVVELEAHDKLGRAATVAVDLFAGGAEPVTWAKPATPVFAVTPDKASYKPGETAKLVLESPFQNGEALVAVEAPDGANRYSWLPVRGGTATFDLPIEGPFAPKIPVHFLLMRGRLPGTQPVPGNATDLGKPATFGATAWLDVEPVANRVEVDLKVPPKARPAQQIPIEIHLATPDGKPAAGEVTLWLVDQAVLALAREARLDPVPSFMTAFLSRLEARDTRSLVFGFLPFAKLPGGGEGEESKSILDRQTVRKNFQPVPYYNPSIEVGADGRAVVQVKLSDDLTNFMVRAKAVSGAERFGFGVGKIEIRQPVVVQPSLPRFARAGDRFTATAVARLVEGEAGPGAATARGDGVVFEGAKEKTFDWTPNRALRLDFAVTVPTPAYDAEGRLSRKEISFKIGAERKSDGAGDAFEVKLPLRDDRDRITLRALAELAPAAPYALPEPTEAARDGSLRRKLLVSNQPSLVALAAGLDFLLDYPYGCTEQRISTTRAQLALRRFRDVLHLEGGEKDLDRAVADTLAWLPLVEQPDGLFAFWPGSAGSVSLTAWAVEFLAEAKDAGYRIDAGLSDRATAALVQALRSDYSHFIDGESWAERTWALRALAHAGKFDAAYGDELARRAQFLDLENVASVIYAFQRAGKPDAAALRPLEDELWQAIVVRLYQGKDAFGGLHEPRAERNPLILPSDARTISELARALAARADSPDKTKRFALLAEALTTLGKGDGWGSTNANAAAILALTELAGKGFAGGPSAAIALHAPEGDRALALSEKEPTAFWLGTAPGKASVTLTASPVPAAGSTSAPRIVVRAETSYLPAEDGSKAAARREGFVVTRELDVLRGDAAKSGGAPERIALAAPGRSIVLAVGEVVEEHVQVVNPEDRTYVAIVVPLAAGFEPLNPNLDTAPPEAKPSSGPTLAPTYAAYLDDQVAFYYNSLPKGTYDFTFRTRAQIPGSFIQPPAKAQRMYDESVVGTSPGARIEIAAKPEG